MPRQVAEHGGDLFVAADIAVEYQFAAKLRRELGDALAKAFAHIGKSQGGAFAAAGLGDAVGDGPVRQQAGNEDVLALQESHGDSWKLGGQCKTGRDS